ncbi:hypothetical protein Ssi02_69010 [Sinosporangium siamense]|uniref:HTH cro/C1-type domain-containing protein n=1 Tax=Sinosporangium siamense TaxID=1367973 RepID=A0A919RMU1_9ACTN|nr:hypothetical protein Ssi02_69010 [Sinosporangium siamense]
MSLRALADRIRWHYSLIAKWEQGRNRPSADAIIALDTELGAGGALLAQALHAAMADLQHSTVTTNPTEVDKDAEMERRQLLHLAAGMGAGALSSDEPIRSLLDPSLSEPRTVEDWELACADHLHAIHTRPAQQVNGDLLVDLLTLQRQITSPGRVDLTELHRVLATLAAYEGSVLTRLANPGAALRWYRTARAAADASGERDLRVRIRAHEAGHSLYGLRDPATVLRLTDRAEQIAGDAPSTGLAMTLRIKAHALAAMGRHDEARQALRLFLTVAAADVPAVAGFWEPSADGRVDFTAAQVHGAAGRVREAGEAVERILRSPVLGYHAHVNARLAAAQCTVVAGGIDEGVRLAAAAIASLPQAYRNVMVTEMARRVLRAVPLDQRERSPVTEFRVLAIENGAVA